MIQTQTKLMHVRYNMQIIINDMMTHDSTWVQIRSYMLFLLHRTWESIPGKTIPVGLLKIKHHQNSPTLPSKIQSQCETTPSLTILLKEDKRKFNNGPLYTGMDLLYRMISWHIGVVKVAIHTQSVLLFALNLSSRLTLIESLLFSLFSRL